MDFKAQSLRKHQKQHGKIAISSKFGHIKTKNHLSVAYTPGVAAVSSLLARSPELASEYTIKGNTIAVVSDGSAVLGLGNVGPIAALPVMEGKALLFKQFAGIDAYPIVLSTQDTEEIINAVSAIAPTFCGINLEDISAPRCFEIETKLKKLLPIPVFHDDQHGTAIVVLAGLINALKVVHKQPEKTKIVICGAGAAGISIAKLLHQYGFTHIVVVDSQGIVINNRKDMNPYKQEVAKFNREQTPGDLGQAVIGADVFVGVSAPDVLTYQMVQTMQSNAIVFALSNPNPEIDPLLASQAGAKIVATGRSDQPNQINNVLAFPGIFRAAIDLHLTQITTNHQLAAALAISDCVPNKDLSVTHIVPSPFDSAIVPKILESIQKTL